MVYCLLQMVGLISFVLYTPNFSVFIAHNNHFLSQHETLVRGKITTPAHSQQCIESRLIQI